MLLNILDYGLQWYDQLLVFAEEDFFERYVSQPERTSPTETVLGVFMVLAIIGAAAAILAKMLP